MTDKTADKQSAFSCQHRVGFVTVFTGDGKGKTTAAVGTAVRAAGYGLRTCIVFFLKGAMFSQGEVKALEALGGIDTFSFGVNDWIKSNNDKSAAVGQARRALETSAEVIRSGRYDLIIMDEVNNAVDFGLIDVADVLDILRARPAKVDVILTGRNADKRLIEASDTVTEMKCVKHVFERGIKARSGIDY